MSLKRFLKRLKMLAKISQDSLKSDEKFLEDIYQELLGRGIDESGKETHLEKLKEGHTRESIILNIVQSEEFKNKVIRENIPLLPIKNERPEKYHLMDDIHRSEKIWVFKAEHKEDFDWLEKKVLENGYYEKPGVWSFEINEDKRLLAEIASVFYPKSVLDIGCANGPVIKCLKDLGIHSEGVEISQMALAKAFPDIRENIHFGDLLEVDLSSRYDLILGLDIYEHLNPNKLDAFISRIYDLLSEGGYLFCNIPAFGKDVIFGEVFQVYIKDWEEDIHKGRFFQTVHVDNYGYPVNGHIIGADSEWWVDQFEKAAFKRELEIEKALHKKYDEVMGRISVARKSFYIFSKNVSENRNQDVILRLNR